FATIVTGFVVAIPALFLNLETVTDLCSIGTLFAFCLVCVGVLVLQDTDIPRGKFRIPYINSKYIMPIGVLVGLVLLLTYDTDVFVKFVKNTPEVYEPQMLITELDSVNTQLLIQDVVVSFNELYNQNSNDLEATLQHLFTNHPNEYISLLSNRLETEQMYHSGWSLFLHKIPLWLFAFALIGLSYWSYIKNLS